MARASSYGHFQFSSFWPVEGTGWGRQSLQVLGGKKVHTVRIILSDFLLLSCIFNLFCVIIVFQFVVLIGIVIIVVVN